MPRILVITDPTPERSGTPLHDELVRSADLQSPHFATQLIERVSWAVADAESAEHARAAESRDAA